MNLLWCLALPAAAAATATAAPSAPSSSSVPAAALRSAATSYPASTSTATTTPLPAPRSDFLIPSNLTYFNPATLGPCPRSVLDGMAADAAWLAADPADRYFGMFQEDPPETARMEAVRAQAAGFLGCDVTEMALMPSTTVAFNTIATGMVESGYLANGDVVLTSDHEHAGGLLGWQHYEKLGRITLQRVHLPADASAANLTAAAVVALFEAAITPRTRVLSISHVFTTNGLQAPVAALAAMAHAHNVSVVVDGAQAPGGLDVNVTALGCDAYAASCHKWMLAPKGNGLLFVAERLQPFVKATLFDEGFRAYTGATGTRPSATIAGLGLAMDYLSNFTGGMAAVQKHNMQLRELAWQLIAALPATARGLASRGGAGGLQLLSPAAASGMASPILTVGLPANVSEKAVAQAMYEQHGFAVKQAADFPAPQPAAIRLGFHVYNSEDDVRALVAALSEVVAAEQQRQQPY